MQQPDLRPTHHDLPRSLRRRHARRHTRLTAADVPEWDSFNHINLIVAIETRFKIKFQTAELEQLHTVGHLAELIEQKLAAQGR